MRYWLVFVTGTIFAGVGPRASAGALPPVPDDGLENKTHKAFAGKIVFAKKRSVLDLNKERPGRFAKAFKLSDEIHFRVYLKKSIKNYFRAEGVDCNTRDDVWRIFTMTIDGEPVTPAKKFSKAGAFSYHKTTGKTYERWATFRFKDHLNASVEAGYKSIARDFIDKVLPRLTAGKHKVVLNLIAKCRGKTQGERYLQEPIARGEFTLSVTPRDLKKMAGKGAKMPKAGRRDAKLEREMKAIIARKWRRDKVLKLVITGRSWNIVRQQITRRILRRTITAAVGVKQPSGKCKVFDLLFQQKHQKGSRYGATAFAGVGNSLDIPCLNLK